MKDVAYKPTNKQSWWWSAKQIADWLHHHPRDEQHRQYDAIESSVRRKITTVAVDNNPAPRAKVSGGVLNGKAINLVKPTYPAAGRARLEPPEEWKCRSFLTKLEK